MDSIFLFLDKNRKIIRKYLIALIVFFIIISIPFFFEEIRNMIIFVVSSLINKKLDVLYWNNKLILFGHLLQLLCFLIFIIFLISFEKIRDFIYSLISNKFSFIILFILLFFLIRIPFYVTPLVSEDGIYADILINHPKSPNYLQVARVDGKEIYSPISHPGLMYEVISVTGKAAQLFINFKNLNDFQTGVILRIIFSLYSFIIFLLFFIIFIYLKNKIDEENHFFINIGLLIFVISPLSISNSIDLQVDPSTGILSIGLLSLFLFFIYFNKLSKILFVIGFICSFFIGFGKNEWSILFILSLIFSTGFIFLNEYLIKKTKNIEYIILMSILFLGCLAGNIFNFIFDKVNYIGGLSLLSNMSQSETFFGKITKWVHINLQRIEYLYLVIIPLVLILIFYFFKFLKKELIELKNSFYILFIISSIFFMAFFMSTWSNIPRYFAPCYIAVIICSLLVISIIKLNNINKMLIFIFTVIIVINSSFVVYEKLQKFDFNINYKPDIIMPKEKNIIPIMGVADCYNKKNVDYIGDSLSLQDAENIANHYNKKLYKKQ